MATATIYSTTAPANKVMSRNAKLITSQKSFLAQNGLDYDKLFSVDYADFGSDLLDQLMPKVQELADKVASVHVKAGFPADRVEELSAYIAKSFSVTAGLNETAKALGIATYENETGESLPSDFFGKAVASTGATVERETMNVEIDF